jgi:DNA-binding NarL/FixJ family response regulator
VAIVDIGLPDMDGIETAARIRERQPATRIILISGVIDQAAFQRGLKAGVLGFAVKSLPLEHVVRMIRDVHAGAFCCCPELTGMLGNWADAAPIPRALAALSSREREILSVLAEGASVKQAAVRLGITYKSADHLKQRVMKKLDLHDRVELVKFAMREGLCGKSTAPETEPMCW